MKTRLKLSLGSSFIGFLMAVSPAVFAGSFALNENSAVDLGRANSGRVTQTDDASAAFGNPALMTRFDRLTITADGRYINGIADFEDRASTDLLGNSLGRDTDRFSTMPSCRPFMPSITSMIVSLPGFPSMRPMVCPPPMTKIGPGDIRQSVLRLKPIIIWM